MSGTKKEMDPRLMTIILEVLADIDIDQKEQVSFVEERALTAGIFTNALSKLRKAMTRDTGTAPAVIQLLRRREDPVRRGERSTQRGKVK